MTKSLYEAAIDVEKVNKALTKDRYVHSSEIEQMLDCLQWAKEFMEKYERKHKNKSK